MADGLHFCLEATELLRTNVSTLCVYVYTDFVRTSQITQRLLISKTDRLMLYNNVIPVFWGDRTERVIAGRVLNMVVDILTDRILMV